MSAAVAAGGRGAVMNQRLGGALRRGKDGVCQRRTVGGVRLRHRQGFDGPFLHLDLDGILDGGVGVKGGRQIEGDGLPCYGTHEAACCIGRRQFQACPYAWEWDPASSQPA